MVRKGSYGKYIFSANEIGGYIVCPESWRLKVIERVKSSTSKKVAKGRKLHREWAEEYDESAYLARSARLIVLLLTIAIGIYVLMQR